MEASSYNEILYPIRLKPYHIGISANVRKVETKKWIICLHGLQSNKRLFKWILEEEFFQPYSILALDLIGFGKSTSPADFSYTLEDQAQVISELVQQQNISQFHLIGHSLGGMLGTLLLELIPNRIVSLISLEGNIRFHDCGASKEVAALDFNNFKSTFYPHLKEKLIESSEPSAEFRRLALEKIFDYVFYRSSKSIVEWSSRSDDKLYQIWEKSTHSKLLIKADKGSFKTELPESSHSHMAIVKNSGHFMLIDQLEATVQLICEFFKSVDQLTV